MKLLYLTQVDPSRPFNGSTRRIYDTLAYLAPRHELHLVYVECPAHAVGSDIAARLPCGLASATAVEHAGRGSRYLNSRLYRVAADHVRQGDFDAVIVEFGDAGIYGLLLQARFGIPFVYMTQNVEAPLHWQRGVSTLGDLAFGIFLTFIERLSARRAALVTAVTQQDAAAFRRLGPRTTVHWLPAGFDAEIFNPAGAAASGAPSILFVGSLDYAPNREAVEFLGEQVIPKVLAVRPDARFEIIGACPPGAERLAPQAHFCGYVEDLSAPLKRARLVVVPVMTGGGMRMKTIEALACGKVVIAAGRGADGIDTSRVSNIKLVPPEDMAQSIIDEISDGQETGQDDFNYLFETYSTEAILIKFDFELHNALGLSGRRRRAETGVRANEPDFGPPLTTSRQGRPPIIAGPLPESLEA